MNQYIVAAADGQWALVRAQDGDSALQVQPGHAFVRAYLFEDQPQRELATQFDPANFQGFFEAPQPRERCALYQIQVLVRPGQSLVEAVQDDAYTFVSRIPGTVLAGSIDVAEFQEGE